MCFSWPLLLGGILKAARHHFVFIAIVLEAQKWVLEDLSEFDHSQIVLAEQLSQNLFKTAA